MGDLIDTFVGGFAQSPWRIVADVADVLVVSWLIYRLLLLVRGTRAMQIAVGLGVLVSRAVADMIWPAWQ